MAAAFEGLWRTDAATSRMIDDDLYRFVVINQRRACTCKVQAYSVRVKVVFIVYRSRSRQRKRRGTVWGNHRACSGPNTTPTPARSKNVRCSPRRLRTSASTSSCSQASSTNSSTNPKWQLRETERSVSMRRSLAD